MRRYCKILGVIIIFLVCTSCASLADRLINGTRIETVNNLTPDAVKVHHSLNLIDLHSDQLLWNRDLLVKSSYGHVDLPRLVAGNVTLQVFSVVTGVPFPLSINSNSDTWDIITLLGSLQGWPEEVQTSRMQRAIYQAAKLSASINASNGSLRLITNRDELNALILARRNGEQVIGAMLALEGAHVLEGNPANIDKLFDKGFRMLGLAHFFDNSMAGSAHGKEKYGLTDKGRRLIQRALSLSMIIDLAHASPAVIQDVLNVVDRPVVVSHTGVRGTCDSTRNLADEQIIGIANTGGVIGIGLFDYATCGETLDDTVRAMRYVADLVGIEYVALGSDFDGSTTVVDPSGLILLTQKLLQSGFTDQEVVAIMGGNSLRVMRETLPVSVNPEKPYNNY